MNTPHPIDRFRCLRCCALFVAAPFLTSLLPANPTTFSLTPTQDALLRSDDVRTENARMLAVSNRGPDYRRRTLLQFDLSALASVQGSIKSASLKLVPADLIGPASPAPVPIALWGLVPPNATSWSEDSISWNAAPLGNAALETSEKTAGAVRLGATEFDSNDGHALKNRRPVVIGSDALASYLNWALARPTPSPLAGVPSSKTALAKITLIVTSEADSKSPGVFFFSKDNRAEAWEIYPELEVTIE